MSSTEDIISNAECISTVSVPSAEKYQGISN